MSPTLNGNLTLCVYPCHWKTKRLGIVDLQCYNCYHSLSDISSKFHSVVVTFHYMNFRVNNIPSIVLIFGIRMNQKKVGMTIFVYFSIRSVIVTQNTIWHKIQYKLRTKNLLYGRTSLCYLSWSNIYLWMVCGSKNGHQKDIGSRDIGLCARKVC
jgi:hypothetical protein